MGNLDLLMVLAGENPKTRPRTNHAIEIYNEVGAIHGAHIPLYLTGSHSGLNGIYLPENKKPLCEQMRNYALEKGIKDEYLILEKKRQGVGSLDTIANFVFADNLIPKQFNQVGLFTEQGHMKRALWCSEKVFSDTTDFTPFTSKPDVIQGIIGNIQEKATFHAIRLDFINIKNGDTEAIQEYMETTHPFHTFTYRNKPRPSFYGAVVYIGKLINARSREKQEFFDD